MAATVLGSQQRPRVGDTCWFICWRPELVIDEIGDIDLDATEAKAKHRRAATEAEALRVAKDVFPQDVFGVVNYYPATYVSYDPADETRYPHAGYWEASDHDRHYDGDESEGGAQ